MRAIMADEELLVRIGDDRVEGWLTEPPCSRCGGPRLYVLAFGATCCPTCNVWLEQSCADPDCWHCRLRPDRPFPHRG